MKGASLFDIVSTFSDNTSQVKGPVCRIEM